jgi:hypothetical protein
MPSVGTTAAPYRRITHTEDHMDRTTGTTGESTGRDPYRDNDDVRAPLDADERGGTKPDTRSEARGDARENVGNHARGTAAEPREGGNDKTKSQRHEKID